MKDTELEYYEKLPTNRRREIRRMLRLYLQMTAQGATAGELQRVLKYSRLLVYPAYRYYKSALTECGVQLLLEKYFKNPKMYVNKYIPFWMHRLKEG